MSLHLESVEWGDPRAVALRDAMNAETSAMYEAFTAGNSPEVNAAIDAALSVDAADIVHTVLALDGDGPVGHAALRPFERELEVKKVFVTPTARGRGVSRALMLELESVARGRGVSSLVLQTGPLQVAAIALYVSLGYEQIPAFGMYGVIANALCYRKRLE